MKLTPANINRFLLVKLPSAWICGVRLKSIDDNTCTVSVTHRWINQNPFNSMYFAVQNMAAELSTGALVMKSIRESNTKVSMLVVHMSSEYYKKATGKITFTCQSGELVSQTIANAIRDNAGKTMALSVMAKNEDGEEVSKFEFTWSVKPKA